MSILSVNWMPVFISMLALLFTVLSFWWMNWRPGRLSIGNIRAFAAGKGMAGNDEGKNLVIVTLPLIFWNSGARPLLIDDLRLVTISKPKIPDLELEAVDDKFTALDHEDRIKRDYFYFPLPLKPNEIVCANCVFEARSRDFRFQGARYTLSLDARLMAFRKWHRIKLVYLDFSNLDDTKLYNLNELYSVFPYKPGKVD